MDRTNGLGINPHRLQLLDDRVSHLKGSILDAQLLCLPFCVVMPGSTRKTNSGVRPLSAYETGSSQP